MTGGCHCGAVRFEVYGTPSTVLVCNCSVCTKKGYLHWIVPQGDFRVLAGADQLTTYTFNTGVAKHHFCRVCGCAPWYIPRSDPDKIDINARCLDDVDLGALTIETFDGAHWEAHYEVYRATRGPA